MGPSAAPSPRARGARPAGLPSVGTRTCVGCGARGDALDMVRLIVGQARGGEPAKVVVDARGGAFGRGAHVHPTRSCLAAAAKKGLPRAFKCDVHADEASLARAISEACARRIAGLLSGGVRGGHVAVGTDAVTEAVESGRMALVIVAADAQAAARRAVVQRATAAGKALVFGDKIFLAKALGRPRVRVEPDGDGGKDARDGSGGKDGKDGSTREVRDGVAVCAVTDRGLADAVRRAWLGAAGLAMATEVHRDDAEGE